MKIDAYVGRIDGVSQDIWSSMVNIPVALTDEAAVKPDLAGMVISSVQIVGGFNGAVCLDMSLDLARRATASLIGAEPDELSPDDVRDAAGELANMTGGGIKELFHDACQISLPTVVMGTDFQFSVPQGVIVYRKAFATEHGHFLVTVLEGEAQPAAHEAHHLHHEHDKGAQPGTVM